MSDFNVGTFCKYEATRDIRLGSIENFQFSTGDTFEYDGVTLRLRDGRTFEMTHLRNSILKGWFVPVGNASHDVSSQSAGIQVSSTESRGFEKGSKTTLRVEESDEAEVGSVAARRENRERREKQVFERPSLETPEAQKAFHQSTDPDLTDVVRVLDNWAEKNGIPQVIAKPAERAFMPVVRQDDTENSGTFVATVERDQDLRMNVAPARPAQPAPIPRDTFSSSAGVQVFEENRNMGRVVTSSGDKPPIALDAKAKVGPSASVSVQMSDSAQVGSGGATKVARTVTLVNGSEGVAVGRVLSPTVTSFTADPTNTRPDVIRRTEEGRASNIERFMVREGETLEDILPEAAVSPKIPVEVENPDEEKLQMIRMLIPEFKWDKDRPTRVRVQEALKYLKKPEYMRAILMYETETCATEIKKEMAKVLKAS